MGFGKADSGHESVFCTLDVCLVSWDGLQGAQRTFLLAVQLPWMAFYKHCPRKIMTKILFALLLFAAAASAQAPHQNQLSWTITLSPTSDPIQTITVQSAAPCSTAGCTGAGIFTTIATLAATATSYVDSTPKAGANTYYQLIASNPGGTLTSNTVLLVSPWMPPTGTLTLSGSAK